MSTPENKKEAEKPKEKAFELELGDLEADMRREIEEAERGGGYSPILVNGPVKPFSRVLADPSNPDEDKKKKEEPKVEIPQPKKRPAKRAKPTKRDPQQPDTPLER
jgi:hypothetical protein